jgi:predicted outer membrane repeat protein
VLITFGIPSQTAAAPTIIYVDSRATGANTGTSWPDAYTSLQTALSVAVSGEEIWVAAGTYTPGPTRSATFLLSDGLAIFGGFSGDETERSQRDWQMHPTVLSGDIGVSGDPRDNSYHIVTSVGVSRATTLDGFTIAGGNANDTGYPHSNGGGMANTGSSPTLRNLIFIDNAAAWEGGAIFNEAGSAPTLGGVTFLRNAAYHGGGMANFSSNAALLNVTFHGNTAREGGGLYNDTSAPTLGNAVFSGNTANERGGAISNRSSAPVLSNVTAIGNVAAITGGGMYSEQSSRPIVRNAIFWNNGQSEIVGGSASVQSSLVTGGYSGTGNISGNPQILRLPRWGMDARWGTPDDDYGDFRLRTGSPAIDSGDASALPSDIADLDQDGDVDELLPVDMAGASRVVNMVNMGAYESVTRRLYVNAQATGANDGTSWQNAYTGLRDALAAAGDGSELWIASGTYMPGTRRGDSFAVRTSVALYGGFSGSEVRLSERHWQIHPTILSGDIGVVGSSSDNSYHVVTVAANSSILDGFIVVDGNAEGSSYPDDRGGGALIDHGTVALSNIIFTSNHATIGGAVASNDTALTIDQALFTGNTAASGGAISSTDGDMLMRNATLSGNVATAEGGALYNQNSLTSVINTILWRNSAPQGSQVFNTGTQATIQYSIVENGYAGSGNLNVDPRFSDADGPDNVVGTPDDDFRLRLGSPAIDAGNNFAMAADSVDLDGDGDTVEPSPFDLGGRLRLYDVPGARDSGTGPIVDMGAYETPVLFVDADAAGKNDGTSWHDAYTLLQDALAGGARGEGVAILVAEGTYTPGARRADTFLLAPGVPIYGGFAGTETAFEQRNWRDHPTILSGDIGFAGTNDDNSLHVVTSRDADAATILDGFTITSGNASGENFPDNSGGGMLNENSRPTIRNTILLDNRAAYGAGMYNVGSGPAISNVVFSGNLAQQAGGAIYNDASSPLLTNTTLSNNGAGNGDGGGMFDGSSSRPTVRSTLLWGNHGSAIGGVTADVAYSLVQGGYSGIGIINADPGFVSALGADGKAGTPDDDLRLRPFSPAIDAGSNAAVPLATVADLDGAPRFVDDRDVPDSGIGASPIVDIGAYEYHPHAPSTTPSDLTATSLSRMGVALAWTNNDDNAAGFVVERSPSGTSGWGEIARVTRTVKVYRDRGLSCNTRYFYRVRAFNAMGSTTDSAVASATTGTCVPTTIYVNAGATSGANDGLSWSSAYTRLQDALSSAIVDDEIWVAQGVYKPTTASDRNASFRLVNGSALYGGFNGTETTRAQRDWQTNLTILSGDIGVLGNSSDNSYHVVVSANAPASTVLDGFTITAGNATVANYAVVAGGGMSTTGGSPTLRHLIFAANAASHTGGGLYNRFGSPTLSDIRFTANSSYQGGGMYNGDGSAPTLDSVTFDSNYAGYGGALYTYNANPTLTHVTFSGNTAGAMGGAVMNDTGNAQLRDVMFERNRSNSVGGAMVNRQTAGGTTLGRVAFIGNSAPDGGAIYLEFASPAMSNVIFSGNQATNTGGALFNNFNTSNPTLSNVTFSRNTASSGGAIYNRYASPIIRNSIFWGNTGGQIKTESGTPTITYSIVQGGYTGPGNRDADPMFVDSNGADDLAGTADDNLDLRFGSPAVDSGNNDGIEAGSTDIGGHPRLVDDPGTADSGFGDAPLVDMGAYEYQARMPSAAADTASTDEDTPVMIDVLANDHHPDPSERLRIVSADSASSGATVATDGANVTYSPALNFNGTETFSYTIEDTVGQRSTSRVTVVVSAVNDPPRFTSTPLTSTPPGTPYSYAITAADVEGPAILQITADVLPAWLTLTDQRNGTASLAGTPGAGDSGEVVIALRVTDDQGASDIQQFTLSVSRGQENPPHVAIDHASGKPGSAFTVTCSNYQPATQLRIRVNDIAVGEAYANADGTCVFVLITDAQALPGKYRVAVTEVSEPHLSSSSAAIDRSAEVTYWLDRSAPRYDRGDEGEGQAISVPPYIWSLDQSLIFVPLACR